MKRVLIILAVVFVGCHNPNAKPTQKENEYYYIAGETHSVEVVNIDGCQYLYSPNGI